MHILITGASGMVGTSLTKLLVENGHKVSTLSRSSEAIVSASTYQWNIETEYINPLAFENIDGIIHLAGAGIADKRWSKKRKKEILDSRTKSTRLLAKYIEKSDKKPLFFISASAIGYYGAHRGNELLHENSPAGNDFLAEVCTAWEQEALKISAFGVRVCCLRIGIVLSKHGGALAKLAMPVNYFAGAYLGNGRQWVSWIHVADLCRLFMKAAEDTQMQGIYNAVAPHPAAHKSMVDSLAKTLKRPVWPMYVPPFILRLLLGEMAAALVGSVNVSSHKAQAQGFVFTHTHIENAIQSLY